MQILEQRNLGYTREVGIIGTLIMQQKILKMIHCMTAAIHTIKTIVQVK